MGSTPLKYNPFIEPLQVPIGGLFEKGMGKVQYILVENRRKVYEYDNHLGNVLTTVSDRRKLVCSTTSFEADVINTYDYSPFGAPLPGRSLGALKCSQYSIHQQLIPINESFASSGLIALGCSETAPSGFYVLTNRTKAQVVGGVLMVSKSPPPYLPNNCGTANGTDVTGMLFPFAVAKKFSVVGGRTYSVSFKSKKGGNVGAFFFRIIDIATNTVLIQQGFSPGTTSFTQFTAINLFNVTNDGAYRIEFFRIGNNTNAPFFIDDVIIQSDVFYVPVQVCTPTGSDYRFGSGGGGQEKDNEIYGEGNCYTAEYWEYDTRLGRRWNVDPGSTYYQSPYNAFNNNPLYFTDPLGLKGDPPVKGAGVEEMEDIKYLRRHDKQFRKDYRELQKMYRAKGETLTLQKSPGADKTLNGVVSGDIDPSKDPSGAKGDVLYYSAVEGSVQGTYYIAQVQFYEYFSADGISVSSKATEDFDHSFTTTMPRDLFSHWSSLENKSSDDGIIKHNLNQDPTNPTNRVYGSLYNGQDFITVAELDYNGQYTGRTVPHDNPINYAIYSFAYSKPLIIKVPYGKVGEKLWGTQKILHYKKLKGEQEGGDVQSDDYKNISKYK